MPGYIDYPGGRVTELGYGGYGDVAPGKGGTFIADAPVRRSSGSGGGSMGPMIYPDVTGGSMGIDPMTGQAVGSGIGQQQSFIAQEDVTADYDTGGYQPQELDQTNGLNGVDTMEMNGWGHEDQPDDTTPTGQAQGGGTCAMDATEWAAHQAQMAADADHTRRRMWWWLAGGAVAGYFAARMMR